MRRLLYKGQGEFTDQYWLPGLYIGERRYRYLRHYPVKWWLLRSRQRAVLAYQRRAMWAQVKGAPAA